MRDKVKQRAYQKEWMRQRRTEWFSANGPCKGCGSWDNLQIHHKDRAIKVDHCVWSWSEARKAEELSKCVVLCRLCHVKASVMEGSRIPKTHGTMSRYLFGGCRCVLCRERRRAYWRYCTMRRKYREQGKNPAVYETEIRKLTGYPKDPEGAVVLLDADAALQSIY